MDDIEILRNIASIRGDIVSIVLKQNEIIGDREDIEKIIGDILGFDDKINEMENSIGGINSSLDDLFGDDGSLNEIHRDILNIKDATLPNQSIIEEMGEDRERIDDKFKGIYAWNNHIESEIKEIQKTLKKLLMK